MKVVATKRQLASRWLWTDSTPFKMRIVAVNPCVSPSPVLRTPSPPRMCLAVVQAQASERGVYAASALEIRGTLRKSQSQGTCGRRSGLKAALLAHQQAAG